ncbi:MAG: 4-hydroxythreonine-4-phosphate dehydrogenase PdxA [Flavobacteriaceae bacterium]
MVKNTGNIIVGISIGDLNGVGSEIILKTFEDTRMLELCTPVIFAGTKVFSFLNKTLQTNINFFGIDHINQLVHGKINVLNVWKEPVAVEFGKSDPEIGKYAVLSFKEAVKALKNDEIDVLITAPINKYTAESKEFQFAGHTEYLAQELQGEALMLLTTDDLRVGLLTGHIPLQEVASKLNEDLIRKKALTLEKALIQDFGIHKPKIAVLGLNPHSGDEGVIGREEIEIITPAIQKLFDQGHYIFGPFSADGFFGSEAYKKYDAVLATYHDQGLIPFKTIAFGQGVNYTAGLDKIRTSPDHGTAFDIAGKGIADESSFREAIYMALDIYKSRLDYEQISTNPLKITEKQSERR